MEDREKLLCVKPAGIRSVDENEVCNTEKDGCYNCKYFSTTGLASPGGWCAKFPCEQANCGIGFICDEWTDKNDVESERRKKLTEQISNDVYGAIKDAGPYDFDTLKSIFASVESLFEEKYGVPRRKKLSQCSWEEIASAAESGKTSEIFEVGDEKEFELFTGEKLTAVILGFNHDDLADGSGKAAITFGLKNIPDGWYEMNENYTNEGGWAKCKMRNTYMQRFFRLLPEELSGVIKPVTKKTNAGEMSSDIDETRDALFLFSEIEVFGKREYSCEGEGEQYPYFVKEENRVKNRARSANGWWLRSPYEGSSLSFCYVSSYGNVSINGANNDRGAVFGFCI